MSGRIGSLSEDQAKALVTFKDKLSTDLVKDDGTYLRFLRARKYVVEDALKQYRETCEWRKSGDVDTILERPQPLEEETNELIASTYHGFDKDGRPLYMQITGTMDVERLVALPMDDLIHRHIYHNEMQIKRAEQNSVRRGKEIDTISEIHDMSGMGMMHRKSLGLLKTVISIDQSYYPERLGRLYFVNVPKLFFILWQIAKLWLDPVTSDKFILLTPSQMHKLKEYIDEDQLPVELGGTCVCPPSGCFGNKDVGKGKVLTNGTTNGTMNGNSDQLIDEGTPV